MSDVSRQRQQFNEAGGEAGGEADGGEDGSDDETYARRHAPFEDLEELGFAAHPWVAAQASKGEGNRAVCQAKAARKARVERQRPPFRVVIGEAPPSAVVREADQVEKLIVPPAKAARIATDQGNAEAEHEGALGAAAAPRTPTYAEVASIFNPSTGLCVWEIRPDQCELTYGHGAEIVGRRVTVYWEEDKKWYDGTVKVYKPASMSHVVKYDDGDKRHEKLHFVHTRWHFLVEPTSTAPEGHADTGTAKWAAAFGGVAGHTRTRVAGIEAAKFASLAAEVTTLAAKLVASSRFLEKWQTTIGGSARAGMAHAEDDGEEDDDEEDDGQEDDDGDEEDILEDEDDEDEEDDEDDEDEDEEHETAGHARAPFAAASSSVGAGIRGDLDGPVYNSDQLMRAHNLKLLAKCNTTESGVTPGHVSESHAKKCAAYLSENWRRSGLGGLMLRAKSAKSGKSFLLEGFNAYNKTLGDFDANKQRLHTLIVKNHKLGVVRKRLPGFHDIEVELIEWLNKLFHRRVELWEAHGLRQGPETQDQASFSIHQDTEEDEDVLYTVVVKLTADVLGEPPSAMSIVGQAIDFEYGPTAGASATFLSDLFHTSVAPTSENEHLKMTYFFKAAS